ncbi:NERD domain-containing protein [Ilumatobacter sp.]|uniref:nuclease-related domain-containing DEAD/DEAH box helicase n=1 Tax=Ilumatobacter sp. TaxID=1967498 RepID=UPI003B52BA27
MAELVPTLQECVDRSGWINAGEERVARALGRIDDRWTVYVQPRLGLDRPDFVALHRDHGICAIEVKEWRHGAYRNQNGEIQYRTGDGWAPVREHPCSQGERYRSTIYEHHFARPADGGPVPPSVRAIVILLNHPTHRAREVLRCAQGAPGAGVAIHGDDVLDHLEDALIGPAPARPCPVSLDKAQRHLETATYVNRLVAPDRLSRGASNIARNPNGARMRRVRGSAGCGKSYGLAARAAALAAEGKSTLVVSYNITLSHYLRSLISRHCASYGADPALVSCVHFHGFCRRLDEMADPTGGGRGGDSTVNVVDRAIAASETGARIPFDAILVDEGQDFELSWWNLLRAQLRPDGEMLLVADPTQNIFDQTPWTEEEHMVGAGFSGPWTDLGASHRLPSDVVSVVRVFGERYVPGDIVGPTAPDAGERISSFDVPTARRWQNVPSTSSLPLVAAQMTSALVENQDDLDPSEVVVLCESHDQGLRVVRQLERRGHEVNHIFASNPSEQQRRKQRFWVDAPGIKACTVHSFKGWESRAVIVCIGGARWSPRLGYVALTRLKSDVRGSYVGIVNAHPELNEFRSLFKDGIPLPPPAVAPDQVA